MKIGFLGPKNTFSEKAAIKYFGDEQELIDFPVIEDVVEAVENGSIEKGIVPIENFYEGEVSQTINSLLSSKNVKINDTITLRIVHCLGCLEGSEKITEITSKQEALSQCRNFIRENYAGAKLIPAESTAGAAKRILSDGKKNIAAIASESALDGLKIVAKDIAPNNRTRFVIISKNINKIEDQSPSSTLFVINPKVKDKPGIIADITNQLRILNINLTYIQSRPDRSGGYYFFFEANGNPESQPLKTALEGIKISLGSGEDLIRILGVYPLRDWKNED